MNTQIQNLAMISAVLAFAGCHSNKTTTKTERKSETENVLSEIPARTKAETIVVEGTVKSIFNGKDGFTANIQTKDNKVYMVTVSRANLSDPKQYRSFNTNEVVKVNGDYWKMNDEDHVTVRTIL